MVGWGCSLLLVTGAPEVGKHPRCCGIEFTTDLVLGSIHIRYEGGCCNGLSKLVHSSSKRGESRGGGGGGGGGGGAWTNLLTLWPA